MLITRDSFLGLLRTAVIHSAPVDDFPGLDSFAVIPDITMLNTDNVHDIASSETNWFYSNSWAASAKKTSNIRYAFPILAVLPIAPQLSGLGKLSVTTTTDYALYFLAQKEHQQAGERQFSPLEIQSAMETHARRVFLLLASTVYASVDGGEKQLTFPKLLDQKKQSGIISDWTPDQQKSKLAQNLLFKATKSAVGGYIDNYTKNALYGVTFQFSIQECTPDDYPLLLNKICC